MKREFETMTFGDSPEFLNGPNYILYRGDDYFEASDTETYIHHKNEIRTRNIWISLGGIHRVQGDAIVVKRKFMDISDEVFQCMHDPEARSYIDALNKMREQHPDFQEDEIVSILAFNIESTEPKVGDNAFILVDIPVEERDWRYEEGDTKTEQLGAITKIKSLGSNLWELTCGEHVGVVHTAEGIRWKEMYWHLR